MIPERYRAGERTLAISMPPASRKLGHGFLRKGEARTNDSLSLRRGRTYKGKLKDTPELSFGRIDVVRWPGSSRVLGGLVRRLRSEGEFGLGRGRHRDRRRVGRGRADEDG